MVFSVLLLASLVHAQQGDKSNAATWYQRAIERLQSLTDEQREMLFNAEESGPTAEQRALITELRPVLELARRGSVQQFSDFGLNHSDGYAMSLPHLGEMRSMARLLRLDAQVRLAQGDSAGAATALATMYRMADHICDDRAAISSLVGQSISTQADELTQRAIDEGKLNAADAMTLLKASMRFSPTDPFRYAEAVMMEQEIAISTVEDTILSADAEKTPDEFAEDFGGQIPLEALTMTREDLRVDVGRLDLLMDRVVETFLIEDRERGRFELEQIEKELELGEHGFFAKLLLPALGRLHERMIESEEQLEKRIKSLREIATGEVTPGEAANAALWYLRGIELLEQMPAEKHEQYRAVAANPGPVVADVASTIADARQPLALFLEGSLMKRCDFSFARKERARLKRDYVGGMRDAVRLVHADAVRLAHIGDHNGAADRLAMAFRMSRHLGDDAALLSALTAHRIFERTAELYDEIAAPHANEAQTKELLQAIDRTSRKDPFGYISGIVSDRALALKWIYEMGATEPERNEAARHSSPKKIVNEWDADRLLSTLLLLDAYFHMPTQAQPGENAEDPGLDFTLMSDTVSLDGVAKVRVTAQTLAAQFPSPLSPESAQAVFERLIDLELAEVAPVRKRISEARQIVRDMDRKLREQSGESRSETLRASEPAQRAESPEP